MTTNPLPLKPLWRRMSLFDRMALAILVLYILAQVAALFGHEVRLSRVLAALSVVAIVYVIVRVGMFFRSRILWRLRNRLIVAYVFIAVVPIVLLTSMLAIGMYLLFLQFGAHLLYDDLQARIGIMTSESQAIANAITVECTQGGAPVNQAVLSRPTVASLISAARDQWPTLTVLWDRGQQLLPNPADQHFAGVSKFQNRLYFVSVNRRVLPGGTFSIVVGEPFDSAMLDKLPSDLGPIQLTLLVPAVGRPPAGIALNIGGKLFVPGERIVTSERKLVPKDNWLDISVSGASTFLAADADAGAKAPPVPVLASFSLRPSSVGKSLFTSVGAVGPYLADLLLGFAVLFLLLELAALVTGVILTRTITASVSELYDATLHVRRADFSRRVQVKARDQLGALGQSFNEMTASIAELIEEQRQRQRLEHEIDIARDVQQHLFPPSTPVIPGLDLAAICRPAKVVSGDYYDFIEMDATRVGIALADISGKGIFAALLMASLQASLRSIATMDGNCGTAAIASLVNRHLFRNTADDRYATLFYGVYDSAARALTYTNAGHLAPFLVNDGCVRQLFEGGTVVGLFENPPYEQNVVRIAPGSLLVVFSDGLTEPENVYGEQFGVQRLQQEVLLHRDKPVAELAQNLIDAAAAWSGYPEQADDMTVVVARFS